MNNIHKRGGVFIVEEKGYNYIMTEKKITVENKEYIVYGVKVSGHQKFAIEDDISVNAEKVKEFIKNIKMSKITPEHLHDIVEDYIFAQDLDYIIVQKDYKI